MPNLAKTDPLISVSGRSSARADSLVPGRRATDGQVPEINAPLVGPNRSRAAALADILGVANDFAGAAFALGRKGQARKDQANTAAGALAGQTGAQADEKLLKVREYADAYHTAGAQRQALETVAAARQAVQERLNDIENPATLADVEKIIDDHYAAVALDEHGRPRDLGSPRAAASMASIFTNARAEIIGPAVEAIKTHTDRQTVSNVAYVAATEASQKLSLSARTASTPPPDPAKSVTPFATTGKLPIPGAVTDSFSAHLRRSSPGLDLDGKLGDPVHLPATGMVIETGRNAKSGNYVRVDHGNGVISSYAHLSRIDVKRGQALTAGDTLGAVGNTGHVKSASGGDGSHLHYRIKVNGKDVDPASFKYTAPASQKAPDAQPPTPPSEALTPQVDFEGYLARIPSSIDRAAAKKGLIDEFIAFAHQEGKPALLDGIANSTKADGSPSFTPEEHLRIIEAADEVRQATRARAKQAEKDRWDENAQGLEKAWVTNSDAVTEAVVQDRVARGLLDPGYGMSFIRQLRAQARQDAAETRAEDRQARYDADRETDMSVSGMIASRTTGALSGATAEDDKRRLDNGELGQGKAAMARFRQLRAAATQGYNAQLQSPDGALYAGQLDRTYQVKRFSPGGSLLLKAKGADGVDQATRNAAFAAYKDNLKKGMEPASAYAQTLRDHPPQGTAQDRKSLEARAAPLRAKAAK